MEITYLTEGIEQKYAQAIYGAKDKESMIAAIEEFGDLAEDALEFAKLNDYDEMIQAIIKERRGEFAGKKYANLVLPEKMFKVSMVAQQFKVPFGTAYIRMKEEGII